MSLLLQALQKAAKNREGQGPEDADVHALRPADGPIEPGGRAPDDHVSEGHMPAQSDLEELSLADEEELFGPDAVTSPVREPSLGLPPDEEPPPAVDRRLRPASFKRDGGDAAHAATILRASESKGTGVMDWIRDRPVHAFAIAGGIFGVFYATYVYLQIFHPAILRGDFMRQPALQARTPPPPPPALPVSPPEAAPAAAEQTPAPAPAAPLAGMPAPAPTPPAPTGIAGQPGAGETTKSPPHAAPRKPAPAETASATGEDVEELAEAPVTRRAKPRRGRQPQVDVESVTLEDSVSVRPPDNRPAPSAGTLTRAWEALQQGRYDEAQKLYDEVAAAEPGDVDAVLGQAAIATVRGNAEQAARLYGHALELDPRNTTAQAGLISIIGQADPQLSESRLKQLLAREPSGFLYFALGNLYAKQSLWPQAQQAYYQAYQLQPDSPDYAYNLAVGLEHLGQSKISLNYYRRALELRALRGRAEFDQSRVEERIGQLAARVGSN